MLKTIFVIILFLSTIPVYAEDEEDLLISITDTADEIIFDGKWSFETEWKHSSLTKIQNELGTIVLRYSHDRENIYVLLDVLSDKIRAHFGDRAMICFDTEMNKGNSLQVDDYCFIATMGSNNPITMQGGTDIINSANMKKISNHPELIAIASFSDEHDRYSKIPHASYEFKIPLEVISHSDVYGFYFQIIENDSKNILVWPQDAVEEKYPYVTAPDNWGVMISPDKSIPEFGLPSLILVLSISIIIFLQIKQKKYNLI